MKTAIGIDIGGTKISVAAGTPQGKILAHHVLPTLTGKKTSSCIENLKSALTQVIRKAGVSKKSILGIGVGIPGPVDSSKGVVPFSPHLSGWEGLPLKKILEKSTQLPVNMHNDANAAALGEKVFGCGRRIKNFMYMTVSTGIGGGMILEGKLYEGKSFVAGEIGHMKIVPNGDPCKCGKNGCLEAYASGTGMAMFANKQKLSAKLKKIAAGKPVTAKELGIAAGQGDSFSLAVYQRAGFYLGVGIANMLNLINPEKVILGGGVFNSAPGIFWKSMMESCRRDAWPDAMRIVKIEKSVLKGHAGDLGALALVFGNQK